jgi:very-short-patch-repair endonuclease
VSHEQLVALGLGRGAIRSRVSRGHLHVVHRGVYAVGHPVIGGRSSLIAAVFACGPQALLSHRAAAEQWGFRRSASSRIDVTVPGGTRRNRNGIVIHRVRALHPDDRAVVEGIPVTSVARTLLDCAAVMPARQLERAVEEAERLRLFDLRAVERLLTRSRGHKGRRALLAAIAEAAHDVPWTRSELEKQFLRLCRHAALPQPAVNAWVEGHEVDAAWLERKLLVELDGVESHYTRAAFERDRKRDIALQLAGYRVVRVTQRRIQREAGQIVGEIRTLLGLDGGR